MKNHILEKEIERVRDELIESKSRCSFLEQKTDESLQMIKTSALKDQEINVKKIEIQEKEI